MPMKFKLKIALAVRGITQKQLAEMTGIRPPTISAIANGSIKQIPVGVLEKICAALDCNIEDIIEYQTDNEDQP